MITFQQAYTKTQRLAKNSSPDTLIQFKEDINTGYHLFNARLGRYYSRKQQFTNLVANQSIYQSPIDSVRVGGMTVTVGTYQYPVKEVRGEFEWRQITSYPQTSNWPTHYFVLGSDEFQLWPTPSQSTASGLRFWYQPQDHDLSLDDVLSTSGTLATAINGSPAITAAGTPFSTAMIGLQFQITGVADLTWYEIVGATTSTLTLKSSFIGTTSANLNWRIGQVYIIPQEYHDAPMHYALGNYFSAQGDESRAQYHLGSDEPGKRGMFWEMVNQCQEDYSSSSQSSIITGDDYAYNMWLVPPPASL